MSRIIVPYAYGEIEMIERKSRFLAALHPVSSEEEARACIGRVNAAHPAATHCVYAYDIRATNSTRFSDAGEPKGTAGMPVYEVFRREEMTNYCCTVVRYFGGILLGAGGLIRAYAGAAKLALDAAGRGELRPYTTYSILCEYTHLNMIRAFLQNEGFEETGAEYGADVTLALCVPDAHSAVLEEGIRERTAGRALIMRTGELLRPMRLDA